MSSALGILISCKPTAMPSPVVPFDTPMESCTSQATSLPRACASITESTVKSGVLVCT